mgnify:CR=1 FL=1
MNKYVVMTGRDDVVVLNADDSKSVKAYIAKGYGITNRIKSKHPLEMSVAKIIKENDRNKNDRQSGNSITVK